MLGHGHLEQNVALKAVGRLGGVVIAWNESLFVKVNEQVKRHIVAVQLAQLVDRWQWVVVSIYSPSCPPLREEL